MIKKLTLLAGVGAGYVLGSKAGRERYDVIVTQFRKLTGSPQAQKAAESLQQAAGDLAGKATEVAVSATDAVKDKAVDLTASATSSGPAPHPEPATTRGPKAAPTTSTTAPVTSSTAPLSR